LAWLHNRLSTRADSVGQKLRHFLTVRFKTDTSADFVEHCRSHPSSWLQLADMRLTRVFEQFLHSGVACQGSRKELIWSGRAPMTDERTNQSWNDRDRVQA